MYKIYLVEDEPNLNKLLKMYLEKESYSVKNFFRGNEVIDHICDDVDLWILDINIPDYDGFQLFKMIREQRSNAPIIFISARDTEIDRLFGYEMGCEDYITKPFAPKELMIRVARLLKYVYQKEEHQVFLEYGNYKINVEKRTVLSENEELILTNKEFDLLYTVLNHINKAYTRDELLNIIWGDDYYGADRAVDDLVRRLRKKMPELNLETMYGYGYRLI